MKKQVLLILAVVTSMAIQSQTINTIAGNGTSGYFGNGGPAINALLDHPNQLAFDQAGNLFIAEDYNNVIRKIDVLGNISTVAGDGTAGFGGDGFPAVNAQLNRATGVAVDAAGNLYICDGDNFRIRKVDVSGNIHTIAGTGTNGYTGNGFAATSADIGFSSGICVDAAGNVYFATQGNGSCIRKIDTGGIISTVAGTGTAGYNGDNILAVNAQLNAPASVFRDAAGNLYIGEVGGMRVRKVNTSGIITTVAGNGSTASGGDGAAATSAQLFYPYGVTVDAGGTMYICESGYNRIRKVDALGIISTFAGMGGLVGGYGGNGGPALLAQFYHPSAVALDAAGNVFIGDFENSAIRKITLGSIGIDENFSDNSQGLTVSPNPFSSETVITFSEEQKNTTIKITDVLGKEFHSFAFSGKQLTIEKNELKAGIYFLQANDQQNNTINKKIMIQ